LETAKNDNRVKLIVVELDAFPLGLGAAQDVYSALKRIKASGKQVEVYVGNAGIKEYLIASVANKIHMDPDGELRLLGLRSSQYFLKGTFDKVGIKGEFLAKGKYKTAPEMFTRETASEINRQATLERLKAAEKELLKLFSESRNINSAKWRRILEHALYGANDAKNAGLIDNVESFASGIKDVDKRYWLRTNLNKQKEDLYLPPKIAIIVAQGDILQKQVPFLSLLGEPQVTPSKLAKRFSRALRDPRTKAIVLRVNSPGGEILASHEIASLVESAKEKKLVVVSMGDVAASGGYMISAPADKIYAQPLTITGSIGVFLGKFNLGQLYKKVGLNKEILSHSPYADLFSEHKGWSPKQKNIMIRRLDQYYEGFVSFVARKRNLSLDKVEAAAQGRVWLGAQAKSKSLIDVEGSYLAAIRDTAAQVGLETGEYEIWGVKERRGLFDFGVGDSVLVRGEPSDTHLPQLFGELAQQMHWKAKSKEHPLLYRLPNSHME